MYLLIFTILFLQCYSQCILSPFNFIPISSISNYSSIWYPGKSAPKTITFAPCSAGIPSGCGTGDSSNQCTNKANCCAVCQTWVEDIGPAAACLGLTKNLLSVTTLSPYSVKISYGGGDPVLDTPRQVDIMIYCDYRSSLLTFVDFIVPPAQFPPPPIYLYTLILSSSTLCGSGVCNLPGFDFIPISSGNNYSSTWTPPGTTVTQTISYAPCSGGLLLGCGYIPNYNQCMNKSSCCAVCQSWTQDTGPVGVCLGLADQVLNVSAISSKTVKITYGQGDPVDYTPRQVDILITCDPSAFGLDFVAFQPAVPKLPPPPFYLYTLTLISSKLCVSGEIPPNEEELMQKLKDLLPGIEEALWKYNK
jgi:hypothetical protein